MLVAEWIATGTSIKDVMKFEYALMTSAPPLTLPPIAPPLPDVFILEAAKNGTGLVVVRPLMYDVDLRRAVEDDEREVRQVDLMDLHENLLPQARIQCRQFLLVEGIQRMVTVEVDVKSLGRELVAREQGRIVGVIVESVTNLSDVVPACHGPCGRGCLPPPT